MALDSPELAEYLAALAMKYGVEKVILKPTFDKAWEYKDGKVVKADVSVLDVNRKGRRLDCIPHEEGEAGFWSCAVFDEKDNLLSEKAEQLPA